jgi:eukaryotic-like serine/threonine-protein kinase
MRKVQRQSSPQDGELPQQDVVRREPSASRRSRPPRLPSRLGHYRLESELASGGMATLYLAHDQRRPGVHGVVAIKQLHPHLVKDPTFREMFFDEARVLARLRHTNVCALLDYELGDSRCYMVLEYLAGEPLGAVGHAAETSARPLDQRAALFTRAIADACEGLHAAHELRDSDGEPLELVHRDVSPDNLLLCHDGQTKILDFGVAASKAQSHKTRTGIVKGKFGYIQPEVLGGASADRRADVWGLGVVLWELLTGRRLFRKETDAATLQAVLDQEIPAPSAVRPELPSLYDPIVLKALERDPERRYANARELGQALTHALFASGVHVGLADLAEWMDELFPGARVRRQELVSKSATAGAERSARPKRSDPPPPPSSRPRPALLPPSLPPSQRPLPAPLGSASGVPMRAAQRRIALAGAAFGALAMSAGLWHCVDGANAATVGKQGMTASLAKEGAEPAACPARPNAGGTRDYVLELRTDAAKAPHRVVARVPAGLTLESGDPSVSLRLLTAETVRQ